MQSDSTTTDDATSLQKKTVTYDRRSFILDGEPFYILSGSIHYIRTHPQDYSRLFSTLLSAGLNTLETYIFWSSHVPTATTNTQDYDFKGRKNLWRFIDEAHKVGLKVILRIGPYVCAEVSYGGLPTWLRDVDGMELRTWNEPFMRYVGEWVRWIGKELVRRNLVWNKGGPVILVQLENEYEMISDGYNEDGQRYLKWIGGLLKDLDLGIPAIMCYGSVAGCVETINSFYAHEELAEFRILHPDIPPVWTECWTGWYDVWGVPHHVRDATDVAYAIARFVAAGGAGFNYYMWFGGTNYERDPMYLQTTSYDYDAPIDEFGLATTKSNHLSLLHRILIEKVIPVLMKNRSREVEAVKHGKAVQIYNWDGITFFCNDTNELPSSGEKNVGMLHPTSVKMVDNESGNVVFDTASITDKSIIKRTRHVVVHPRSITWRSIRKEVPRYVRPLPNMEQFSVYECELENLPDALSLTKNATDYCFYSTLISIDNKIRRGTVVSVTLEAADFVRIFINGELVASTPDALYEDRFSNKWNDYGENAPGFSQMLRFAASNFGTVSLTIMTCFLGMVKGDWQLGNNMLSERKGLLSIPKFTVAGQHVCPITYVERKWQVYPGIPGDQKLPFCGYGESPGNVPRSELQSGPCYYAASVDLREHVSSTSLVLDLSPLSKGLLWVNGVLLGRFWTIAGTRPPTGFLKGSRVRTVRGGGEATQRYYHIPKWVMDLSENFHAEIEIFSETGECRVEDVALLEVR